jgi:hypothetical protein
MCRRADRNYLKKEGNIEKKAESAGKKEEMYKRRQKF